MNNLVVAVTGANGFLGQFIVSLLSKHGIKTIGISRSSGYDITNRETLKEIPKFDCLIHLAAHTFVPDSYNHTAAFFTTNINGTLNALELCKNFKARFLFASSYVYGQPAYLPVDENHPVSMWNPYASSKIICEQLCHVYNKEFNVPVDILRIFNIYGPGQNPTFLIPKVIKGILGGELNLETLIPKRDFIHVADVANAFFQCLASFNPDENYHIYNVGSGTSYSVQQIVDKVISITGKTAIIQCNEKKRAVEVEDVRADISKIRKEKNWSPQITMEQGLKELIAFYS